MVIGVDTTYILMKINEKKKHKYKEKKGLVNFVYIFKQISMS